MASARVTTMKPEKQQQQRQRQHETLSIPEDVVVLFLNRLPLKSLYRLKVVSKSWSRLIGEKLRGPLSLGLFYQITGICSSSNNDGDIKSADMLFRYIGNSDGIHNSTVDPTLSFLPLSSYGRSSISILDCCNGLLLLKSILTDDFFVCNPLTRSWTRFRVATILNVCSLLDFDPQVCPHFRIVSFSKIFQKKLRIFVLSSESPTKIWIWRKPVDFGDPSDEPCKLMSPNGNHALWEGSLYLSLSRDWLDFGDHGKVMSFSGIFEGDGDAVNPQLIEFPVGTKKPTRVGMGRLKEKLCLVGLDWINYMNNVCQARLRVWSLSTRHQAVWVMEHDAIISSTLLGSYNEKWPPPQICGFHPLSDIIFILCNSTVYAYDFKKLLSHEVCSSRSNPQFVMRASVFPLLPSLVDYGFR